MLIDINVYLFRLRMTTVQLQPAREQEKNEFQLKVSCPSRKCV